MAHLILHKRNRDADEGDRQHNWFGGELQRRRGTKKRGVISTVT